MSIRKLERGDWNAFCLRATRGFLGRWVDVEAASLQLGYQNEGRLLPLVGMSYDPKSDVLELLLGELEHLIRAPRELYVDEQPLRIVSMQVVDADGVRQIVTFGDPLMLPGPNVPQQ
jgi:Family of unknown function (DUF5335)